MVRVVACHAGEPHGHGIWMEEVCQAIKLLVAVDAGARLIASSVSIALKVQVNLIITLSLGSIETDRVISEPCYNEVIYY